MPTRASSLQNSTLTGLTREVGSKYDEIKLVADNISAVQELAGALQSGVDLGEIVNVVGDVAALELAMDGKVDKVVGSSLMTDAEHTKLAGVAVGATVNQTDAYLLDRVNHTGVQSLDTTTDTADRLAMTAAERLKLSTIESRSNHTGTQSADTLTDGVANVAMTIGERSRLAAMEDGANNYVHPASHPVSILDGGTNYNKVVKTDALGHVGFGDVSWTDVAGKPSTYTPSAHEHSLDEVVSGTISATRVVPTETRQFVNASQLASIADMELQTNKGIPNGYAPLNANGKINASYIADLNLMEVFTPNDLNSMLNLTSAQPGDVAYRLDTGNSYMLIALPSSLEANWKQLNSGAGVVSINGLDGIVTLGSANVPESGTNYYFTNERVDDRVIWLLQAGNNISLNYDDNANTLTVSANDTSVDWGEIQNKPDPVVTVTLQGDVTGTANATMTDMGNATVTVTTAVAANSVALGTDTTGNYVASVTQGTGVSVTGTAGEGWSPTVSLTNVGTAGTYKSVTTDAQGRVIAGTNPTTLSGYGITDATPSSHVGSTGTAHGVVTTSVNGFMSSTDKSKLDGMAAGANNYVLPKATSTDIGGVKVSATAQTVAANAVTDTTAKTYAVQLDASNNAVVNVPWVDTNTVYTHPTSGVAAGTYRSVTVNTSGHITTGTNPTTVSGYGLTDVYTKTESDAVSSLKANLDSPTLTGTPRAPTAAVGTSTTQLATTAFVQAEIANDTYSKADVDARAVHKTGDTMTGNLNFASGTKIQGDFSNPTIANRVYIQSSIPGSGTYVSHIPNATGFGSQSWYNYSSDPLNTSRARVGIAFNNEMWIMSEIVGTATYAPICMHTGGAERLRIDTSGNVLVTGSGGLGYGTGSGGTVTQLTSKGTAVTLNKPCGRITMNNASLASNAIAAFQVNNSLMTTNDTVLATAVDTSNYEVLIRWNTTGGFVIQVKNVTAGALAEALQIQFAIIKGATA